MQLGWSIQVISCYDLSPDDEWDKPTGGLNQLVSMMMLLQVLQVGTTLPWTIFLEGVGWDLRKDEGGRWRSMLGCIWAPTKCIKIDRLECRERFQHMKSDEVPWSPTDFVSIMTSFGQPWRLRYAVAEPPRPVNLGVPWLRGKGGSKAPFGRWDAWIDQIGLAHWKDIWSRAIDGHRWPWILFWIF